jgi:hypothetical protein
MKKFLIVALSALLCVCLAGPAMAKIQMGGMITFDSFYENDSEENASGGVAPGNQPTSGSLGRTQFQMPTPFNRLNAKYTSDDGMIGGFIELRGGGGLATNAAIWNYGWIDWRFNPSVYLRIGRQTQAFSIMAPQTMLGFHASGGAKVVGLNFGNLHGGSSRDSIRLYWKFNDMIRMELQAMDPDSDPTGTSNLNMVQPGIIPGAVPQVVTEENPIPRFDLALPITVGGFTIEPSFSWVKTAYENTGPGSDDSFDSYGLCLGVSGGFGPVVIGGEFTWGRNLGGANYVGAGNWGPTAYDSNADGFADTIEDTDGYAWWFHLGVKLGPATIYGIVGNNSTDNDGNAAVANDALEFDISQWMYGVSVPISVAKGFTIRPEFMYYDFDGSAQVGGVNGVDRGDQWYFGVQWMLAF